MNLRSIRVVGLGFGVLLLCALPLAAAPNSGKITGVVVDPKGTPQMGATVSISAEHLLSFAPTELLTNDRGRFSTATLAPGMYSVKVTLAGFLPAIEQHIQVSDQQTTLLEIVLGSVLHLSKNCAASRISSWPRTIGAGCCAVRRLRARFCAGRMAP